MQTLSDAQGRVEVIGGGLAGMITALELAPRDVVARSIHAVLAGNGGVFLDARPELAPDGPE